MAITLLDIKSCDKASKCSGSVPSSKNYPKFDFPPDDKRNIRSPYLPGDRVQLFSRLTEKRYIHNTNFVSSFPLARDLYKTNSDDFKPPKKAIKKVKKSVLTLPNAPTPVPHVCTVSDMNESEYFDKNEDQKRKVVTKRTPKRNKRKARVREKDFEFYDRDAQYCSQLNLDLDCSSTDMMKNFNGDGRRVSNMKKILPYPNKTQTASNNLSDVWAVLRNANRFQFRPSPPMSEESIVPVKKKLPKKGKRKESRVIGTCRTQEFAYISSYELNKKSSDVSPSSSIDRITVIDNQDDFGKICEEFEKQLLLTHDFLKDSNNSKNVIQKNITLCKSPRSSGKALSKIVTKDNKQLMIMKKINNLSPRGVQQIKNAKTNFSSGKDSLVSADTLHHGVQQIKNAKTNLSIGKDSLVSADTSQHGVQQIKSAKTNFSSGKDALVSADISQHGVQQIKSAKTNFSSGKDSLVSADTLHHGVQQIKNAKTNLSIGKDSLVSADTSQHGVQQIKSAKTNFSSGKDALVSADTSQHGVQQIKSAKTYFSSAKDSLVSAGNLQHGVQPIKSAKTNFSSRKNSVVSADTLQHFDNYDILSHKTTDDSMCPGKDSLIGFDNSRSSKAELSKKKNEHVIKNDIAVLHKDRQSTASTFVNPKLTQTEIKRRLATMKFPIVILGKDQVSSSIKVTDYNPPQFDGLDDHIWPFMMEWSQNIPEYVKQNTQSRTCKPYLLESDSSIEIKNKSRKSNTEVATYKQKVAAWKDKKDANNDLTSNKIKAKFRPTPEITDKSMQCIKKQKSIVQLKDKMLNFLYKKSSNFVNNDSYENDEIKHKTLCKDNSAIAEINVPAVIDSQLIPDKVLVRTELPEKNALSRNKKTPIYKYSWAKAKWASDFIENVMKKVRSGVYYTQDRMDFRHTHHADMREVSVQAGSICDSIQNNCGNETDYIFDETTDTGRNILQIIPGFDNNLPLLEIKTLNVNQIAVKHCVTNSMVQFDVTIPVKRDQNITSVTKMMPLTPIAITESQTVIYKCTTTILNAILPAELCSILPKMMSSIIDSNNSSLENSTVYPTKTNSWLSTITELARSEIDDSPSITAIQYSPEIKEIFEGRFSNIDCNKKTLKKIDFKMKYDQSMVTELLPIVPLVLLNNLLKYKVTPLLVELDNSHSQVSLHQSNKQVSDVTDIQNTTTCTTLQMYTGNNEKFTSDFKLNKFVCMIERMMRSYNLQIHQNLSTYFDMLKLQYDAKNVKINVSLTNDIGIQKKISVTVSNLNIDSLCKAFPKIENDKTLQIVCNKNNTPLECIEYVNIPLERKTPHTERTKYALNKIKRKGFSKLYRKCKTTSISSEAKCTNAANVPLDKITTADDLFQILGSKKIFSSVLDENAAKKILSSVAEIKNWTSEINPKQALLILLLANKKDTQNLVRFRPIILQGIAVNRITRASELDMEIEVIDRENFNKLSQQCDGITYLPETVTDYENLLDELYWIAKTTASDYNKPFNESSEKLLKSLLQKRKRLNPSYLRVMARYVGLGLVKTPTEC